MQRKDFQGLSLPRLAMGNMRLPTTEPGGPIDREKAQGIIDYVYESGVNYFDTAYMYHGGASESFLGEALAKYPRESYFLASKMPGFMLKEGQSPAEIFEEQLSRCKTEYFDFYLLHNVSENSVPIYNDPEKGIIPYLLEQKKLGRIRHLGFSSHSKPETLKSFLDQWDCFEFVQIQLNYLDWTMQDAKSQYEIIAAHGLPVWVMEPCRGGRLASLSPEADEILKATRPDKSVASWAFRYLLGLEHVQIILSGMTTMEQAQDNVATFSEGAPLDAAESDKLQEALALLLRQINVPCTACHYCDGCPMELEIPDILAQYNKFALNPGPGVRDAMEKLHQPDTCIACGACVSKCPQNIDVPAAMQKFAEGLAKLSAPRP